MNFSIIPTTVGVYAHRVGRNMCTNKAVPLAGLNVSYRSHSFSDRLPKLQRMAQKKGKNTYKYDTRNNPIRDHEQMHPIPTLVYRSIDLYLFESD